MRPHELSRVDARRLAVRAQLLDRSGPADLLDVVHELTLLQADLTAAVAPNADLVAWSRLGSWYSPDELMRALADRTLVELRGMIRPAADIALYRAEMAEWGNDAYPENSWRSRLREWVAANDACRRDILDRLERDGAHTSRELPDTCAVAWRSSGWNNDRNVTMLLELMEVRGEVAADGRRGRDRVWDLAARIYPDEPAVATDTARRIRNERRLHSLGIARARTTTVPVEPNDVGEVGEPAVVAGVKGEWRVDPALLDEPFQGRAALLSPLDRLVFDRKRMAELFEFDYQLEMYKPATQRRWGYFALPILYGDQLVGKVDAAADREAGVLRVHAIHRDELFTDAMTDEVYAQITDLADWLGLELVLPR